LGLTRAQSPQMNREKKYIFIREHATDGLHL
jgi:hypothetical protein